MKKITLDPSRDEDYANILLHDVPVNLQKKSQISAGPIKLGEKRAGKVKELKLGKPLTLTGTRDTSTTDLEKIEVNEAIGSIALRTRNSVYTIEMADQQKDNRRMSLLYLRRGYLDFDEKMPDGFYDGGRQTTFVIEGDKMNPESSREIVVLSQDLDPALKMISAKAKEFIGKVGDLETKIKMLAMFVSNKFGGSQFYNDKEFDLVKVCEKEIEALTDAKSKTRYMQLGYLNHGVCRHRSLLFKYLADRLDIPSRLVRGDYGSAHAWNVVKLADKYYVVDVMHDPTQIFEENSSKAQIYKRKGLNGAAGGFGGRSVVNKVE